MFADISTPKPRTYLYENGIALNVAVTIIAIKTLP